MSYDIWIEEKNWKSESINYTSNCSGMWHKALGIQLRELDETKAEKAIEILDKGIKEIVFNQLIYKEMNPLNGWGNHNGARIYLEQLLELCQKYPDGIIKISY
jgi:hypothetical protein